MISADDGDIVSPIHRRFNRPVLRQATLILPRTGERVRRTITLRSSRQLDGADRDEPSDRSPLLGWSSKQDTRTNVVQSYWKYVKLQARTVYDFTISTTGQGVFKCSLAYLVGSLATFVPAIANFLGHQDGKHMVATVTVYFHPARTQGSMLEAIILAALAFIYAAFISFTSMGVSILFGRTWDLLTLGHIIVLVLFCGGGLGFVGWVKQKLGMELVNVACSLASLAIITVLTKEGAVQTATFSADKVVQVMKMVIMGVLATVAICFSIRPQSARKKLRENLIHVTSSLGDMLAIISRSFLTGSEDVSHEKSSVEALGRYQAVYSTLSKNLKEAKSEHFVMGTEREYHLEARLVDCMQRLAHSVGGLRSAAATQFILLGQSDEGAVKRRLSLSSISSRPVSPQENYGVLEAIHEAPEGEPLGSTPALQESENNKGVTDMPLDSAPADIFERFILHLGPSMKSLAYTVREILDALPFGPGPRFEIAANSRFRHSLTQAMALYANARKEALSLLYKNKEVHIIRSLETEAVFEEVAASCGHFSSSLLNFAEEMKSFLDVLDDLKLEMEEHPKGRTWDWLKVWRKVHAFGTSAREDAERGGLTEQTVEISIAEEMAEETMAPAAQHRNPILDPEKSLQKQAYTYRLWKALSVLRRDDTKFAIKVGCGAALFASPSFIYETRSFYSHWRGEWGLLSYMLVCSMTIGASNTTGSARFFGTCLGAICAIVTWTISQGNPIILALLGWCMSLWTSYLIVAKGKGPMGRFIMLTYNLSALYAYSLSVKDDEDDDDEGGIDPVITEIGLHRVVAVMSGCLWGLVVTRLIWPISARRKFKDGLSLLWLRMGLVWRRDPLVVLTDGESDNSYMNLREEFEFQRFLSGLEGLRKQASSEFELKGPFPDKTFNTILKSTGRMLDAFHAMNVIILKDLKASHGEAEILRYTSNERVQLCARISHLFQVLASSLKLEYPLNDALPNTDHTRDRLLAKIFAYRRDDQVGHDTTDEDFALLYAYALVTGQLCREIDVVEKDIEKLYGVLDEDLLKLQ